MQFGRFALAALFVLAASAAQSQDFDFETATATSSASAHPGSLTTLTQTSGGLTATFTRPGSTFDIVDTSGFAGGFPAGFGTRSLDPFADELSATAIVVDFSAPVSSVSFDYGDFGGDSDTATLNAFSGPGGTGTLLATATDTYGLQSLPVFDTITASAAGINSITMIGGSTGFPDSVYYDNLIVTTAAATPEPGSIGLFLGLGATGMALLRRRKRAHKAA